MKEANGERKNICKCRSFGESDNKTKFEVANNYCNADYY